MNALETERSSQLFSIAGSYRLNKPWLSGFEPRLRELKTYSTMGLDQRNVDALFVVGNEPDALEGLLGSYDPQFTGSKLQACEECVQPTTVDYAGYDFYSWGEDKVANLNLKLAPTYSTTSAEATESPSCRARSCYPIRRLESTACSMQRPTIFPPSGTRAMSAGS